MSELEIKIEKDIKNILKEERYKHSIGVMEMAEKLANYYGLDKQKARVVGLAHDIAKEMTWEEVCIYIKENNIKLTKLEEENRQLIHSRLGADICKKRYSFDKQMANAILYHTTGNPNMDMFAKVIFMADKIEKRRNLAFENIDKAIIDVINSVTLKCIKRGLVIHPDSIKTRNSLL